MFLRLLSNGGIWFPLRYHCSTNCNRPLSKGRFELLFDPEMHNGRFLCTRLSCVHNGQNCLAKCLQVGKFSFTDQLGREGFVWTEVFTLRKASVRAGGVSSTQIGAWFAKSVGVGCRSLQVKFKQTKKRFTNYQQAKRFLNALRYKVDEGEYDHRDFLGSQPMGFANLGQQWLDRRELDGTKCVRNLRRHIQYGVEFFGNQNIKDIGYGELEDFFHELRKRTNLASKSLFNIRTTLRSFFHWVEKREGRNGAKQYTAPELPEIRYTMEMRKILDKNTQMLVLDEVKKISWNINPKIYLGCLWLSTYINTRPGELIQVLEKDIDRQGGTIHVHKTKERDPAKAKKIYLLDEDPATVRDLPPAMPHLPFFRHEKRKGAGEWHRARAGGRFGKDYLWKWWRDACRHLGIEEVPLYPGTRHTTAVALSEAGYTPEEIMEDGTQHSTSRSFHRYYHQRVEKRKAVSQATRSRYSSGTKIPGLVKPQVFEIVE
jgi:integrase